MTYIDNIKSGLYKLNEDGLRELNTFIVGLIRAKTYIKRSMKAKEFSEGDTVTFLGKRGNNVIGEVTKVNRVNLKVTDTRGIRWNVAATFCSKLDNEYNEYNGQKKLSI